MPVEFLTDAQAAAYGRYSGPPSTAEMDRFFLLDDKALGLIEPKRLPHTRLGCAVQVTTLLFMGTLLADPTDVPTEVVDHLAEQLGIEDPSCVKAYRAREMTRLQHAREIRDAYGFGEFTGAEQELIRWVDDRAWTTGDGPKALFDGAVAWLRQRRVLLPGVSTLARLVARVRDAAMQRLWDTIAGSLSAAQAHALELLLEVGEGARTSDLERLRRGQTRVSGRAMLAALDRVSEITALGLGQVDVGAVPRRRVVELARYGMAGKAPALRRHPYARRVATLLATVVYLQGKATDDAVELFDVLMTTELLARAQRQSRDGQARRYPRVSKDAGKLAAAVGVLLEAAEWGPEITLQRVWDAIEDRVSRAELRTAVANITEVVPAPGAIRTGNGGPPWSSGTRWCARSCRCCARRSNSAPPPRPPRCWRRCGCSRTCSTPGRAAGSRPGSSTRAGSRWTWCPRAGRGWCSPPGAPRPPWTGPVTCSVCSSSSTSGCGAATFSQPPPPGGPTRARSCWPGRRGRPPAAQSSTPCNSPPIPTRCWPSTPATWTPRCATSPAG